MKGGMTTKELKRMQNGSVGLGSPTTAYEAEVVAVAEGLLGHSRAILADTKLAKLRLTVLPDSQAVVHLLCSGTATPKHTQQERLVITLVGELRRKGCFATPKWIPAHCGVPINEFVDHLAQAKAEKVQIYETETQDIYPRSKRHPVPLSSVKAAIKNELREMYSTAWQDLNENTRPSKQKDPLPLFGRFGMTEFAFSRKGDDIDAILLNGTTCV